MGMGETQLLPACVPSQGPQGRHWGVALGCRGALALEAEQLRQEAAKGVSLSCSSKALSSLLIFFHSAQHPSLHTRSDSLASHHTAGPPEMGRRAGDGKQLLRGVVAEPPMPSPMGQPVVTRPPCPMGRIELG